MTTWSVRSWRCAAWLLFRLLRGHRFDRPDFRTEAIAEIVPKGLIAPGRGLFEALNKPSRASG